MTDKSTREQAVQSCLQTLEFIMKYSSDSDAAFRARRALKDLLSTPASPSPTQSAAVDAVAEAALVLLNALREHEGPHESAWDSDHVWRTKVEPAKERLHAALLDLEDGASSAPADWKALFEAAHGALICIGQMQGDAEYARATADALTLAALTPAPKPVEVGGEAVAFITKLVNMQSGQGWTRAVVRDAAANFLKQHGIAITGHADTTDEIAALAKPAPAAEAVREALRAIYEWYDRDGSVGGASEVFEEHRAALAPAAQAGTVAQEGRS